MFENLASLAVSSILSIGVFANSILGPGGKVVSPLPEAGIIKQAVITPTNTPTPLPTSTPQPKTDRHLDITPTPPPPTPTPTQIPTPTPTPTTVQAAVTGPELDNFFTIYSSQYGVDREELRKIALCESGFNTNASYLGYGGMYQFSEDSWRSTRAAMGQNTDPALRFNAEEAVKTAAYKISQPNGTASWPSCK